MPETSNSHEANRLYRLGAWFLIVTPLFFFFLQQFEAIVYGRLHLDDYIYLKRDTIRGIISGGILSVFGLPVSVTGVCVLMRVKKHIIGPVGAISVLPFFLTTIFWISVYGLPDTWAALAFAPIVIACFLFMRANTRQQPPAAR